jgi:hypothetical protein
MANERTFRRKLKRGEFSRRLIYRQLLLSRTITQKSITKCFSCGLLLLSVPTALVLRLELRRPTLHISGNCT